MNVKLLAVASVLVLSAVPIRADIMSLTGSLANADDVYTTTFTLTSVSEIDIQTWGYAGGTNASGTVIPEGGFDPAVALFLGAGPSATLYDFNDDGACPPGNLDSVSGFCLDSTLGNRGSSWDVYIGTDGVAKSA